MSAPEDQRLFYPAAERNAEPIFEVLARVLPAEPKVLEVASGSGQHAAHFAARLPGVDWQPSDGDSSVLLSILAWTKDLAGVREPVALDVEASAWPVEGMAPFDAVYNANMIHISPWSVCRALMRGAGRYLRPEGVLVLYGPFRIGGGHTAASNEAFDASLKARDPRWGVRDLEEVCEVAGAEGLVFEERVEMPANNQVVVFRR